MDREYFKTVEEASSSALRIVSRSVAVGVISAYVLATMIPGVLAVVTVPNVFRGMADADAAAFMGGGL